MDNDDKDIILIVIIIKVKIRIMIIIVTTLMIIIDSDSNIDSSGKIDYTNNNDQNGHNINRDNNISNKVWYLVLFILVAVNQPEGLRYYSYYVLIDLFIRSPMNPVFSRGSLHIILVTAGEIS